MRDAPLTDQKLSLAATEFVWDVDGNTNSHDLLLQPVLRALAPHKPARVLDLGCGNGAFTKVLSQQGYQMDGCDGSSSGLEIARRNNPTLQFWQQDFGQSLPADRAGLYDAVVSTEVIEHLLLPRGLLQAAMQALRPGGVLVLSAPYHGYLKNLALALTGQFDQHWHPLRDFGHIKFFSRATLTALVRECGFVDIQYATAGRIPMLAKSMIVSGSKPK